MMSPEKRKAIVGVAVTAVWGALTIAVLEELYWRSHGTASDLRLLIGVAAAVAILAAAAAGAAAIALPRHIAVAIGLAVATGPTCLLLLHGWGVAGRWRPALAAVPLSLAVGLGLALLLIHRRTRFILPALAVALVLATFVRARADHVSSSDLEPKPNVILIVLDTTRPDHLSMYGYPRLTSPMLDAFARDAEVYEDAWSVAPWTPPSHASMLTGLLPAEHGVDGEASPPFATSAPTLTRTLKRAGYRTAAFLANPNLAASGWDRDFDAFHPPWSRGFHSLVRLFERITHTGSGGSSWTQTLTQTLTPRVFADARSWWSEHRGRPRFLFLNLLDPHRPYAPPPEYYRRFLGGLDSKIAMAVPQDPAHYQLHPGVPPESRRILCGLYDGEIASMDHELGAFLAWLRESGDLDRTVVVITADHGERLGERGLVGHDLEVDQFLLRVPLVVRYPPRVAPARVTRRVQLDGIAGYVLELAGIPAPSAMARSDLSRQDRRIVVAQYQEPHWFFEQLWWQDPGFRTEPWHGDWNFVSDGRLAYLLREDASGPLGGRLVDLEQDPEWTHDLAAEQREAAAHLESLAERLPRFQGRVASDMDEEQRERLRALGYVN